MQSRHRKRAPTTSSRGARHLAPILALLLAWPPVTAVAADELVIGIFPRRDAALTMRLFRPLAEYLSGALGRDVRIETAADFAHFRARLDEARFDLIHVNQFQYIHAHERLGYSAIAQSEELGESAIRGAIVVRADSGIDRIAALRGKTVLFGGGREAMMSYIVPAWLLQRGGLGPDDYQQAFAVNPPNAVLAVFLERADAAGTGEIVRRLPVVAKRIDTTALRVLAQSEPLPQLPWAVHARLDQATAERLRALLLGMGASPEGRDVLETARLTGLNPASDADYDAHRAIIAELGETPE